MSLPAIRRRRAMLGPVLGSVISLLSGCARPHPLIEDLSGHENLSSYTLQQVRGTRDGDRLDAEANIGNGSSDLIVQLHFAVGAPTKLISGRWQWSRDNGITGGTVAERSVMFLGGQDGPPSVGGRYDLLGSGGTPAYRIDLPTTQLKLKLPLPPNYPRVHPE